jgi:hypothetical protein
MTVLDMADARSRRVGVAGSRFGDPRAGNVRGLAERHLEFAGLDS